MNIRIIANIYSFDVDKAVFQMYNPLHAERKLFGGKENE